MTNNSKPVVSVLMPVRDAENTLDQALASLQRQTLNNIELVVVDHASRRATAKKLAAWAKREPRLRLLRQNGGTLLDALNRGLKVCRAPWVARADADDLSRPQRLAAQLAMAKKQNLDLIATKVTLFPSRDLGDGYRRYEHWVNGLVSPARIGRDLLVECPLPHPTWLVRRDLFRKLGGYRDDTLPEDYQFVLRAAEAGAKFGKVARRLVAWREHPGRHSRLHPRYSLGAFYQLKAKWVDRLFLKGRPCVLWGAGKRGRLLAKELKKHGVQVLLGVDEGRATHNRTLRGAPLLGPGRLPRPLPGPLLACVGTPGAASAIRQWCRRRGLKEWNDFVVLA